MCNPFERFYDTEIELYEPQGGSYSNGDTKTYIGRAVCDLQPLGMDTEDALYGLSGKRQYKIFADKHAGIKVGNLVRFGGGEYRLVSVEEWSLGLAAVMRSVCDES